MLNGIFQSIAFRTGDAVLGTGTSFLQRYKVHEEDQGVLVYEARRPYKSALLFESKRLVGQTAYAYIKDAVPNLIRKKRLQIRDDIQKVQKENNETLLGESSKSIGTGFLELEGGEKAYALSASLRLVKTAMFLSFVGEEDIKYNIYASDYKNYESALDYFEDTDKQVSSKTVFVCDLAPTISLSSTKQVILTQVQGRDYSRKEMVGNGDLKFTVSGKIVSNHPDIYPKAEVDRLMQIFQYKGIVDVSSFQFNQRDVTRIIIQDWSLGQPECLNEQPYQFTCVAVEPDVEANYMSDTLITLKNAEELDSKEGWFIKILESKLGSQLSSAASSVVADAAGSLMDKSIIGF